MASLHPVELFSLTIPPDNEPVPALVGDGMQATFRITMAAIDPTAPAKSKGLANGTPEFTGSVLKIIRVPIDDDDESDEDDDEDDMDMDMADLLDGASGSEDDDEDITGAPSDPSKSPKAKRMAALKDALAQANGGDQEDDDDEMELDAKMSAKAKGKARAMNGDEEDESDIDDSEIEGAEEFVLCTLDPTKAYQQPLDITISEYETVYFRTSGTHKVYLTGNILVPVGRGPGEDDYDSEDEEFDLPPGADEEGYPSEDDESDELDDMEDPRVTELASSDEEDAPAPKLIKTEKAATGKGKNKRPLQDSSDIEAPAAKAKPTADDTLAKSLKPATAGTEAKPEHQMSKSQLKKMRKKMKDNQGNAIETTITAQTNGDDPGEKATIKKEVKQEPSSSSPDKSDKKVSFAAELVQGPSGSAQPNGDVAKVKTEKKPVDAPKVNGAAAVTEPKPTGTKGVKTINGITVDDRKLGSGPAAKKGSKVSMRYIGKLEKDKRVFDSNKKGAPFKFTLGAGDVIQGWDIGLQGIAVGGERRITVPPGMAYGSKKMGDIPGNSTLVFDVKCLEVK